MVSNRKAFELLDVSKRAENGPLELGAEIYFSGRAIAEFQPYHVVLQVPRLKNVKKRGVTPVDQWFAAVVCSAQETSLPRARPYVKSATPLDHDPEKATEFRHGLTMPELCRFLGIVI